MDRACFLGDIEILALFCLTSTHLHIGMALNFYPVEYVTYCGCRIATDPSAIRSAESYVRRWYDNSSQISVSLRKEQDENLLEHICRHISLYPDALCREDTLKNVLSILTKDLNLTRRIVERHDKKQLQDSIDIIAQW